MKNISDFLFESLNDSWIKIQNMYGDNDLLLITYNNGRYEDPFTLIPSKEFEKYNDIIRNSKFDCPCKDIKLKDKDTFVELHVSDINGDFMHWVYIVNSNNKFTTYVCNDNYEILTSFNTFDTTKCGKLMELVDDLANFEYNENSIVKDIDNKIKSI